MNRNDIERVVQEALARRTYSVKAWHNNVSKGTLRLVVPPAVGQHVYIEGDDRHYTISGISQIPADKGGAGTTHVYLKSESE